ncbi:HDOD domain-containing protein [Pseudodesulfovibrio sp.]|uniref:HDOD domain-containing protein n=1 Tax=Pseudodesulfovibrio sp. TaxID=2035812 RepID=UPI002608933F|nr:HDOD domain-containing protein [Pseudodesulfovibrio sp.]MDD3311053.1 HDOD domain-containing protein [Pseudodesulfovibrio sp.]
MPILTLDSLEPGMVLAEDLTTPDGRMLLPKGAVLTESHLRTCRVWGIPEAAIQGEDDGYPTSFDQIDPEVLDVCKLLAARRFVLNPTTHPAVREIARLFVLRQARGLNPEKAQWMLSASPHDDDVDLFAPSAEAEPVDPEKVVDREMELASLPDIYFQISESLRNPRSSAAYVAEVISKDVALAAKLLRMVNSPFYGFTQKIDTLSRAVTIVGTAQLTNLALGLSVISVFEGIPEKAFTLKEFWFHSVACGILSRLLAVRIGLDGDEKFFVAGLLHDIGRLVMLRNHPRRAGEVLNLAASGRKSLVDVERSVWGCTHADIGGRMLRKWGLPDFLAEVVAGHHQPKRSAMPREAAVVNVADFMAHGLDMGESGPTLVPELNPSAWDALGIPVAELAELTHKAERQADTIMAAFFPRG